MKPLPAARTARWSIVGLAAVALVLAFTPVASSTVIPGSGDPHVSDSVRTLFKADLAGTNLMRISGLKNDVVTATYTGDSQEIFFCPANLVYTLNGATPGAPGTPSPVASGCGAAASGASAPGGPQTYAFTLTPALLKAGPTNTTVKFRIDLATNGPLGTGDSFSDNNGGNFFKFLIDKTAANLTNLVPAPFPGASIKDAVTGDNRTPIQFRIRDEPTEAPLDAASITMKIDTVDATGSFTCTSVNAWARDCAFAYSTKSAAFVWGPGTHTVVVAGQDTTGNAFDVLNSTYKFRIDTTAPVVGNVTAVPNGGVPAATGGLPTGAPGATATVTASVTDASLDVSGHANVFAQLFNTSANLESSLTPMRFNATAKVWKATNVTVPSTWNTAAFRLSARVFATDLAGNVAVNTTPKDAFALDPFPPTIQDSQPPVFIQDKGYTVKAVIKDNGTGVAANKVMISFGNVTGTFKTTLNATSGVTRSGSLYLAAMKNPGGDNYAYDLPPANDGAILVYLITAADKAGGNNSSAVRSVIVDARGPNLTEPDHAPYRNGAPQVFRVDALDDGSGVNASAVKLFYAQGGGAFKTASLVRVGTSSTYEGGFTPASPVDGGAVQYYFEAIDQAGNVGALGSSNSPLTFKFDLKAPDFHLVAPPTSSGPRFTINWSATDAASGVDTYTIEARALLGGSPVGDWTVIANHTTVQSLDVCAQGGRTYEFRGYATDKAQNSGALPATAQASTVLSGVGCAETVSVQILSPVARTYDATTMSPLIVQYLASSSHTLTPTASLKIKIAFTPDGTHWYPQTAPTTNTGHYNLDLTLLPDCKACQVSITATTLSGVETNVTSPLFQIVKGSTTADLDGNGLPDSWELKYGTHLGEFQARGDDDHDGLNNADEAQAGTDPNNADTDGDGASDRAEVRAGTDPLDAQSHPSALQLRSDQFTNWYWAVPALFLAIALVFIIGLARRW